MKNPSRKRGFYQSSEEIAWCAMVVQECIGIETVVLLLNEDYIRGLKMFMMI